MSDAWPLEYAHSNSYDASARQISTQRPMQYWVIGESIFHDRFSGGGGWAFAR